MHLLPLVITSLISQLALSITHLTDFALVIAQEEYMIASLVTFTAG